jgi:hypothetical protein
MKRSLSILLLAAPLAACAAPLLEPDAPKSVFAQRIAPYEWHEECAQMARGDALEYTFDSRDPVQFNIHYHEGSTAVFPVLRENVRRESGRFEAMSAQDYCLMWEAGPAGTLLDYRVVMKRAAK